MFKKVFGHEKPKDILYRAIKQGRIGQAYLFSGDKSLGKYLLASEFAKWVNCEEKETKKGKEIEPCQKCPSCRLMTAASHPDVQILQPEGSTIKVHQIRNLQHKIFLKPQLGSRKFYLIDEAEKMNREASNCFLKTLEEPPKNSTVILISSRPHLLLPTLFSRCIRIGFSPFSIESLTEILTDQKKVDQSLANDIAYFCMGRIGKALDIQQDQFLEEKKETFGFLNSFWEEGISLTIKSAEIWARDPEIMEEKLFWLCLWLREILLIKMGLNPHIIKEPQETLRVKDIAQQLSLDRIHLIHRSMIEALEGLTRNHNRQLSLENIFILIRNSLSENKAYAS